MGFVTYLKVLRRRRGVVAISVLVALGAAWLVLVVAPTARRPPQRPTYSATLLMLGTGTFSEGGARPGVAAQGPLGTVVALASTDEARRRVDERLAWQGPASELGNRVEVGIDPVTGLLQITSNGRTAAEAERLATGYADELVEWLEELEAGEAAEAEQARAEQIAELEAERAKLVGQLDDASEGEGARLRAEIGTKDNQIARLVSEGQEQGPGLVGGLQVVQPARAKRVPPPVPPSKTSGFLIAAAAGLLGGIVLALVLERFDTRIRRKEGAEQHFALPVLAEIPVIPRRRRKGVVVATGPRSAAAEAFRFLAAGIRRDAAGRDRSGSRSSLPRSILVTSPGPREGKTTVVANLAATFAELGKKVVVICCDFRQPRIHRLLGVEETNGLAEALRSEQNGNLLASQAHAVPNMPNVRLVATGPSSERLSGLMNSDRMHRLLRESRAEADVVLLDTPPLLLSSEIGHLLGEVDGVLVVARAGRTRAEVAERTKALLERLGTSAIGVVLNRSAETPLPQRRWDVPEWIRAKSWRPSSNGHASAGEAEPESPHEDRPGARKVPAAEALESHVLREAR